jgi:tetratricopeptide (TPR) repeat protein
MDHFDQAVKFIRDGRLDEARIYLEELLREDPDNSDLLYNLGMLYTDLGQPNKAIELLKRCIELSPDHTNSYVALGYAYQRAGDLEQAKQFSLKALEIDPNNPYAMKNLGGIFGKEGNNLGAFSYLRRSFEINPDDPQTVYGLAFTYKCLGDMEGADKYFRLLLNMPAPEQLKSLAKDGLREIAVTKLKSQGLRMDTVFYILNALKTLRDMSFQEIQAISFEIAMLGRHGLDINDSSKKYTISSLPGEFTGLELVCIMYAGFHQIEPGMNVGVDFSQEYELAEKLAHSESLI